MQLSRAQDMSMWAVEGQSRDEQRARLAGGHSGKQITGSQLQMTSRKFNVRYLVSKQPRGHVRNRPGRKAALGSISSTDSRIQALDMEPREVVTGRPLGPRTSQRRTVAFIPAPQKIGTDIKMRL